MCETRLQALRCPQCGASVEKVWKRCPECEAPLVCRQCRKRLPPGAKSCPECRTGPDFGQTWIDTQCGIEMIYIYGGVFDMGDAFDEGLDNETPLHKVRLSAFYMSRTPVTQSQWSALMPDNPSGFQGPDHPVEQVTYADALKFAEKLSRAHDGSLRFALPTEAQWEFAARSGGQAERYAGGGDVDAVAWYEDNSRGSTHPVGRKAPNGLGLHDMSGNVWEWCQDSFAPDAYVRHAPLNPLVDLPGTDRVIRGGSWNLDSWSARCARRFSFRADAFGPGLGFRLVMLIKGSDD
jgi:formylglycine-generating enzyme required for sulfatase activity